MPDPNDQGMLKRCEERLRRRPPCCLEPSSQPRQRLQQRARQSPREGREGLSQDQQGRDDQNRPFMFDHMSGEQAGRKFAHGRHIEQGKRRPAGCEYERLTPGQCRGRRRRAATAS